MGKKFPRQNLCNFKKFSPVTIKITVCIVIIFLLLSGGGFPQWLTKSLVPVWDRQFECISFVANASKRPIISLLMGGIGTNEAQISRGASWKMAQCYRLIKNVNVDILGYNKLYTRVFWLYIRRLLFSIFLLPFRKKTCHGFSNIGITTDVQFTNSHPLFDEPTVITVAILLPAEALTVIPISVFYLTGNVNVVAADNHYLLFSLFVSVVQMSDHIPRIHFSLDFICGSQEAMELETNCIIVVNAPAKATFYSQLVTILNRAGYPVHRASVQEQVRASTEEELPNGINFVFVRLSSMKKFSLRYKEGSSPLTHTIKDATFTFTSGRNGLQKVIQIPLFICPGPVHEFSDKPPFRPCFTITLSQSDADRRNDLMAKWYAITNHYVIPNLDVDVPIAVVWMPLVSRDGSVTQDRLVIGTYSSDFYQDVIPPIVFDYIPPDDSFWLLNGTILRYSSPTAPKPANHRFPGGTYGIEILVLRGSKLPLDYVRDLVLCMGVSEEQLIDVIHERNQTIIVCSSLMAAAIIMARYHLYAPPGNAGWSMTLRNRIPLPSVNLEDVPIRSREILLENYPGEVYHPFITRSLVAPISIPRIISGRDAAVAEPSVARGGPHFAAITLLPRARTNQIATAMDTQLEPGDDEMTSSTSDSTGIGSNLTPQARHLVGLLTREGPITREEAQVLAHLVAHHMETSSFFRDLIESMIPAESESNKRTQR